MKARTLLLGVAREIAAQSLRAEPSGPLTFGYGERLCLTFNQERGGNLDGPRYRYVAWVQGYLRALTATSPAVKHGLYTTSAETLAKGLSAYCAMHERKPVVDAADDLARNLAAK